MLPQGAGANRARRRACVCWVASFGAGRLHVGWEYQLTGATRTRRSDASRPAGALRTSCRCSLRSPRRRLKPASAPESSGGQTEPLARDLGSRSRSSSRSPSLQHPVPTRTTSRPLGPALIPLSSPSTPNEARSRRTFRRGARGQRRRVRARHGRVDAESRMVRVTIWPDGGGDRVVAVLPYRSCVLFDVVARDGVRGRAGRGGDPGSSTRSTTRSPQKLCRRSRLKRRGGLLRAAKTGQPPEAPRFGLGKGRRRGRGGADCPLRAEG